MVKVQAKSRIAMQRTFISSVEDDELNSYENEDSDVLELPTKPASRTPKCFGPRLKYDEEGHGLTSHDESSCNNDSVSGPAVRIPRGDGAMSGKGLRREGDDLLSSDYAIITRLHHICSHTLI